MFEKNENKPKEVHFIVILSETLVLGIGKLNVFVSVDDLPIWLNPLLHSR